MALMNSLHDTIEFTFSWSDSQVNFLDVNVMLNNGVISTDLLCKPTDKQQYLFHTSCHPNSCKRGIPYGQALRYAAFVLRMSYLKSGSGHFVGI